MSKSGIVVLQGIEDVERLRGQMAGNALIMDQESYESLQSLNVSLPARANLVIPENKPYQAPGCYIVDCLGAAIRIALISYGFEKLFVIGNPRLRRLAIALGGIQAS